VCKRYGQTHTPHTHRHRNRDTHTRTDTHTAHIDTPHTHTTHTTHTGTHTRFMSRAIYLSSAPHPTGITTKSHNVNKENTHGKNVHKLRHWVFWTFFFALVAVTFITWHVGFTDVILLISKASVTFIILYGNAIDDDECAEKEEDNVRD